MFSQLQRNLQYWPQQADLAGDQTPRMRGFKAIFKASMMKVQNQNIDETQTPVQTSLLSGDLSAAMHALRLVIQNNLPAFIQPTMGKLYSIQDVIA